MVLTFDGSGVVMRPDGLRPETRKKAEKSQRKKTVAESASTGTRAGEERRHRKRMAEVAAVYSLEAVGRTPEDVIRELRRTGPHVPRPKAQNKRVAVHRRAWNCGVTVTVVIDIIHVLSYLWTAGKALNADTAAVEAWVSERAEKILKGRASHVAAGMRRAATVRELAGKSREAVDECADYLLNHSQYMRYHEYLRDGLPIASGVIEGACRSLVQDRMDITGARWGLPGGEAVLKVRSLRASGDIDEYLAHHARRELERNHLCHYDEHELVELREAA
jgi:hypothetical protein